MTIALEEITIANIHAAISSGKTTASDIVRGYAARIEAYDRNGPALNSIVTFNDAALQDAERLDAQFA